MGQEPAHAAEGVAGNALYMCPQYLLCMCQQFHIYSGAVRSKRRGTVETPPRAAQGGVPCEVQFPQHFMPDGSPWDRVVNYFILLKKHTERDNPPLNPPGSRLFFFCSN